jgi:metal-responsive CopG/Arc/MetJ family transcriptional regulator
MEKSIIHWCVIAPKALDVLLEQAVEKGTYRTKSDLIRDAVRDKLTELGFLFQVKLAKECS